MRRRKILIVAISLVIMITLGSGCLGISDENSIADYTTTHVITNEPVQTLETGETTTTTSNSTKKEETTTTSKNIEKETTTTSQTTQSETTTTTVTTTTTMMTTTSKAVKKQPTIDIKELPEIIMQQVTYWKRMYPNMNIGVGLYSLDGKKGYEYNANQKINGACTIKAAFAKYVLETCEKKGIDIWSTYITFESWHDNFGSGNIILYGRHGYKYSIGYLVNVLLTVSDNVAYNMLLDMFPLDEFYQYLKSIGGEDDGKQWGAATVAQRKNEWLDIYKYVNSGGKYSKTLRDDITNTLYAYIPQGMVTMHNYMHKSGWTEDSFDYPAAGDCCIIDDSYLLVVLTEDWSIGTGHINVIQYIGNAVERYYNTNNGNIF